MTKSKNRQFAELARSTKLAELKDANIPAGLTISSYGATLIDDAHATAARTTLGSAIGTDVQAHSSVLDSTTAAFTTALNTKLSGIEASATADQTAAEIRTLVEAATDSNVFTDADHTKLNGIAASADVTSITVSDGTNSTARTAGSTITFASVGNETTVAESSGTITIGLPSDVTVSNDLTVAGNLVVSGTTTQTGAVVSDDNFTGLTNANTGNATDFGFYGKYVESSTTKYAGLYYDASTDNTFNLFCDTQTEPSSTVNTSATGYAAANLSINNLVVSGTVDGRDVATDGTKLDGIEASADVTDTANVVAALTAGTNITIANDGTITAAGGTNADTLDNLDSTQFLRSDASDTMTGDLTVSENVKADGGNIIMGDDAYGSSSNYVGIKTSYQSGNDDYMMISGNSSTSDGNTYISAKSGSDVHIRGGANTSTYEIVVYPDQAPRAYGNVIWHAGNDGSGTGLDADKLDGYHSAESGASINLRTASNSYLMLQNWINVSTAGIYSSTNSAHFYPNTVTSYGSWRTAGSRGGYDGIVFDSGGDVAIMYDSSGNGGIYRQSGGGWYTYYNLGNSCLGINSSTTSGSHALYVSGNIYSTQNITAYSDARIKENVVTIESALDKVNLMRGVYYNKIDDPDKTKEIGFIAQEVEEVLPEAVIYAEDVDQYGVKYGNVTALLVEAVKELSDQVKDLKAELKELKNG